MAKQFDFGTYDQKHLRNLNARLKKIAKAYDEAVRHGCALGERTGFNDPEGEFDFHDYPEIKKQLDDLLKDLRANLGGIIKEGDREEWLLSCAKNDALVETINRTANFPKEALAQFKHQNMASLVAFQTRKVAGMGLSKRVWQLSDQFKGELELALELGLGEGKSADELSRDVRQYLREPARLFRRVRDEKGVLRLSKAAKAYNPGRGIYRSSYKNALRLTATENNMAYRTADHLRWQQLNFVLGIEIKLSNNHPCDDICDTLAGTYPKDFKFVGWHPFCRCFAVPKLANPEEVADYSRRLADGEDVSDFEYSGKVEALPKKFTDWVKDNQERLDKAKSLPYFLTDNENLIYPSKEMERDRLKYLRGITATPEAVKAAIANAASHHNGWYKGVNSPIEKYLSDIKYAIVEGQGVSRADKGLAVLFKTAETDMSVYQRKALLTHELAHLLMEQKGLFDIDTIAKPMAELREALSELVDGRIRGGVLTEKLGQRSLDIRFELSGASTRQLKSSLADTEAQIIKAKDTLMSLNSEWGAGHSVEYFAKKNNAQGEFLAHCAECFYHGNPVIKELMPDVYEKMITTFKNVLRLLNT